MSTPTRGNPHCLRTGPKDAALAGGTGADAHSPRRVVRALASIGVFTETADQPFGLAPPGNPHTQRQPGAHPRPGHPWMKTRNGPFGGLLKGSAPARCASTAFYGQPFFNWLGSHPEQAERFSRAMADLTGGIKPGAISTCDFTGAGRTVDVGGADGAVPAHILAATRNVAVGTPGLGTEAINGHTCRSSSQLQISSMPVLTPRARSQNERGAH